MHNISEDWKRPQGLTDMNQICKIAPIIVTTLGLLQPDHATPTRPGRNRKITFLNV